MANKVGQRSLLLKLRYPEICMEFKSIEPDGCYFGRCRQSRREFRDVYETRHIGCDQARSLVGLTDFFYFSEVTKKKDFLLDFYTNLDKNDAYGAQDPRGRKHENRVEQRTAETCESGSLGNL
ncbi:uncharacterized protein LOC107487275 [Arachis duranensis]|uniref:Uncharacterized protein LOC107487275 n=1 Tax=Arachis duranensis TaxID=130453 RepID=A0A9C6WTE4_ARADU|nr:uncharacterized protein LOC107487275 [Arachis duranensis]